MYKTILESDMLQSLVILGCVSLVLGLVMVYYYFRTKHLMDEIWAIKPYTARDLRLMCSGGFEAIVKVEGIIECIDPLISPAAHVPCCWYHLKIEWEEEIDENQGRQLAVYEESKSTIFKVCDKTGFILVNPEGAEIDVVDDYFDTVYKPKALEISDKIGISYDGNYKITEEILHDSGYICIIGQARCTQGGTSPDAVISKPNHGYVNKKGHFIVSRRSDRELTRQYGISVSVCYYMAAISFAVSLFSILCLSGVIHIDGI